MTQERILELAYEALLAKWYKEKLRQERGKKEGYKTPIADNWEAIYNRDLSEISGMIHELEEKQS